MGRKDNKTKESISETQYPTNSWGLGGEEQRKWRREKY